MKDSSLLTGASLCRRIASGRRCWQSTSLTPAFDSAASPKRLNGKDKVRLALVWRPKTHTVVIGLVDSSEINRPNVVEIPLEEEGEFQEQFRPYFTVGELIGMMNKKQASLRKPPIPLRDLAYGGLDPIDKTLIPLSSPVMLAGVKDGDRFTGIHVVPRHHRAHLDIAPLPVRNGDGAQVILLAPRKKTAAALA